MRVKCKQADETLQQLLPLSKADFFFFLDLAFLSACTYCVCVCLSESVCGFAQVCGFRALLFRVIFCRCMWKLYRISPLVWGTLFVIFICFTFSNTIFICPSLQFMTNVIFNKRNTQLYKYTNQKWKWKQNKRQKN